MAFSPSTTLRLAFPGRWLGVASDRGLQFWSTERWVVGFDLPL
jgi:hypothetical protein